MSVKTYSKPIHGFLAKFLQKDQPEEICAWRNASLDLEEARTHIGFVYSGNPILHRKAGEQIYKLCPGMYFSLPNSGWIEGEASSGIVITCAPTYQGLFTIGGPVEASGRFAYIDGAKDSLLIPPVVLGDPCLNALYFPPGIEQNNHTHPSYRLGIVLEGSGECETPDGTIQMYPGLILFIPANDHHKFRTLRDKLTCVMFHPDSDVSTLR